MGYQVLRSIFIASDWEGGFHSTVQLVVPLIYTSPGVCSGNCAIFRGATAENFCDPKLQTDLQISKGHICTWN